MLLGQLEKRGLIKPPDWLVSNTMWVCLMGSQAYGCSTEQSDYDIYSWCLPRKQVAFPSLAGVIHGYDTNYEKFDQWLAEHVKDEQNKKEYDIVTYNVIRYFYLLRGTNPNIVDSLFVPEDCIMHCTQIGRMVRDARKQFLHKKCWYTYRCYAASQFNKCKKEKPIGKRKAIIEKYSFDIKFAYHLIRLLEQCKMILLEGDLDLRRNNQFYIAIRSGNVPWAEIEARYFALDKELNDIYEKSKLPYGPDDMKNKALLLNVLEAHYGKIDNAVKILGKEESILQQIKQLVKDY